MKTFYSLPAVLLALSTFGTAQAASIEELNSAYVEVDQVASLIDIEKLKDIVAAKIRAQATDPDFRNTLMIGEQYLKRTGTESDGWASPRFLVCATIKLANILAVKGGFCWDLDGKAYIMAGGARGSVGAVEWRISVMADFGVEGHHIEGFYGAAEVESRSSPNGRRNGGHAGIYAAYELGVGPKFIVYTGYQEGNASGGSDFGFMGFTTAKQLDILSEKLKN